MKRYCIIPFLQFCTSLIIIATATLVNPSPWNLDVSGFERCDFNIIVAPQFAKDISTADFIDLFTTSNQAPQLWTILKQPINVYSSMLLTSRPLYFKEHCSINILVNLVGCSPVALSFIFGSRLYSYNNILYMIIGQITGHLIKLNALALTHEIEVQLGTTIFAPNQRIETQKHAN